MSKLDAGCVHDFHCSSCLCFSKCFCVITHVLLYLTRCWSGTPAERPAIIEVARIMQHLFQVRSYLRNKTSVPVFYRGNKIWVRVWVVMN